MTAPEASQPINPGFGQTYGPGPHYVTPPNGLGVWMWRKAQHVRFYDEQGAQVGPQHKNVVPAVIWAAANGWIDPDSVNLSIACIVEVREQIDKRNGLVAEVAKDLAPVIALPVLLLVALVGWAAFSVWRTRQVRRDARTVLAAMAAEAPCEALGHVRIVPADEGLTVEGLDEDDVYVRIMRALDLFAEESGFDVPVPVVWLAIASVVATAILGEDLAAVLRGEAS